ncbi:MAG: hypothetical protein Q8L18_10915, partial [Hydrogenophaga sp.]|nr:hypothetical protein [Hydrogenophaga sp.]
TGPLLLALPAPKSTARIHHQKWTPGSATIYRHRLPPPDLRGFRPPLTSTLVNGCKRWDNSGTMKGKNQGIFSLLEKHEDVEDL